MLSLSQFPLATSITACTTSMVRYTLKPQQRRVASMRRRLSLQVPSALKGTLMGTEHATYSLAALVGPSRDSNHFRKVRGRRGPVT